MQALTSLRTLKVEEFPRSADPPLLSDEPLDGAHTLRHTQLREPPSLKIRMTVTSETGSCGSEGSFYDRKPSVEFKPPTPDWGYLAQVNEKFRSVLTWDVERIVGDPAHMPMFRCTPSEPPSPDAHLWFIIWANPYRNE